MTASVRRGLTGETKAGRVLSDANAKLCVSACDQLITVLQAAGILIDVPGQNIPGTGDEEDGNSMQSEPLYLPDSTAPGAQVLSSKMLVDPAAVARAYAVFAAADDTDR